MGQCYGKTLSRYSWGRRRRRRRHKAFEFAPKRSWKYKDATLLDQSEGTNSEDGLEDTPPRSPVRQPVTMVSQDSEEEIDTGGGEVRRSGLLAFDEDVSDHENEDDESEGFQTTPLHVPGSASPQYQVLIEEESRGRSESNSSEQIGRFEVMDISEDEPAAANGTSQLN